MSGLFEPGYDISDIKPRTRRGLQGAERKEKGPNKVYDVRVLKGMGMINCFFCLCGNR